MTDPTHDDIIRASRSIAGFGGPSADLPRESPHPFEGITAGMPDRPCSRCGKPDRHPIHDLPRESDPVEAELAQQMVVVAAVLREHTDLGSTDRMTCSEAIVNALAIVAAIRSRPVEVDPERLARALLAVFRLTENPSSPLGHYRSWSSMSFREQADAIVAEYAALSSPEPRKP